MIVVWRITTHCNLSCGFCAYARDVSLPRTEADADGVLRFARLLTDFQNRRGEPVMVSWLGGEPLLWEPVERLSALMSRELGLRVSATTNGTALKSDSILRLIANQFAEITLSVDGPQPFHDAIRGWAGGFERLRMAVAHLREVSSGGSSQYLQRFHASAMGRSLPVADCQPGNKFLFIDEHGRIAPCSFTTADYGVHIADLATTADLDGLAGRYALARRERRSRWCNDCPSTQVFTKFVA